MRPMIACQDCKHYQSDWGSTCHRPEMMKPDVIYGEVSSDPVKNRKEGLCGIGARYFEMRRPWWRVLSGG